MVYNNKNIEKLLINNKTEIEIEITDISCGERPINEMENAISKLKLLRN